MRVLRESSSQHSTQSVPRTSPTMSFILEGTIGSGKSSALESLREIHPEWLILEEPIQSWQRYSPEEGLQINFLGDFYARRTERTFRLLQNQVLTTLLERYTYARSRRPQTVVFERSIEVAKEVFMESNAHLGRMPELQQLRDLADWATKHFEEGMPRVYLRCTPECMLERVVSRGRSCESQCDAVELCKLQTLMNRWAEKKGYFAVDTTSKTSLEVAEIISEWHVEYGTDWSRWSKTDDKNN